MPYGNNAPFVNSGAAVQDALMKFLVERKAEERQKMLDEILAKDRQSQAEDRVANRRIQDEQVAQYKGLREAQENAARQQAAGRTAELLSPETELDDSTADELSQGGLESLVKKVPAFKSSLPDNLKEGDPMDTPARRVFRGTARQIEEERKRRERQDYISKQPADSPVRKFLEAQSATGDNSLPTELFQPKPTSQEVIRINPRTGKMENIGNAPTGAHFVTEPQDAAGGMGGRPYFTYQPVYDAQGRPIGSMKFDARGGQPEFIDIAKMTGGGQVKPPPGTTGAQSIANETAEAQLERMTKMFETRKDWNTGPVAGRAREVGQQIPGVPVNLSYAEFSAASAAFRNAVIKAITGAQMSEPEANRIKEQIPMPSDKPEVWAAKARQTKLNLQDLAKRIKARPNAAGAGSGFKVTEMK